jgi:hypothetical protein
MPTLYSRNRDGDVVEFRTEDPLELVRLRAYGYSEVQPQDRVTVADQQFHPGDHGYQDVLTYLAENPADADRVIAEEKAGKARVSIVGDHAPAPSE